MTVVSTRGVFADSCHLGFNSGKLTKLKINGQPEPVKPKVRKPELVFHPSDEKEFLKRLVDRKSVWVNIEFDDGTVKPDIWYADRIKTTSNPRANIWSGRLRDWRTKGIIKAEFYFDPKDFQK